MGAHVPPGWQGGLPSPITWGPGNAEVHMKLVMDYQQRPIVQRDRKIARQRRRTNGSFSAITTMHGFLAQPIPAAERLPCSKRARALGELARSGWKPRRTIVICAWDGEEPGLLGSTEWVEANRAELQAKAVAYINTDVGVTGPNFIASATPSLKQSGARRNP